MIIFWGGLLMRGCECFDVGGLTRVCIVGIGSCGCGCVLNFCGVGFMWEDIGLMVLVEFLVLGF